MSETSNYGPNVSADTRISELSERLIEARQTDEKNNIPGALLTDYIAYGLMNITTEPPLSRGGERIKSLQRLIGNSDSPHNDHREQIEAQTRQAVFSVRTLIGGLIQGGLPSQHAYDFFTMDDLNLLFYVHSKLAGTSHYPDIPFGDLSKVDSHDC